MRQLRSVLRLQPHLISSSMQVKTEVQDLEIGERLIMVKCDIKDFYVVGEAHIIAQSLANLFSGEMSSLVFDVAYFLLANQYVSAMGRTFQMMEGAGIGLLHAGDVADA